MIAARLLEDSEPVYKLSRPAIDRGRSFSVRNRLEQDAAPKKNKNQDEFL